MVPHALRTNAAVDRCPASAAPPPHPAYPPAAPAQSAAQNAYVPPQPAAPAEKSRRNGQRNARTADQGNGKQQNRHRQDAGEKQAAPVALQDAAGSDGRVISCAAIAPCLASGCKERDRSRADGEKQKRQILRAENQPCLCQPP